MATQSQQFLWGLRGQYVRAGQADMGSPRPTISWDPVPPRTLIHTLLLLTTEMWREGSWPCFTKGWDTRPQKFLTSLYFLFNFFYLLIFRERETMICCSTSVCIHWLILICALTRDGTCNFGVLGRCYNQLRYPAGAVLPAYSKRPKV